MPLLLGWSEAIRFACAKSCAIVFRLLFSSFCFFPCSSLYFLQELCLNGGRKDGGRTALFPRYSSLNPPKKCVLCTPPPDFAITFFVLVT